MSTDAAQTNSKGQRSPSFPFIPLQTAIERMAAFEAKFGRHPTPANKVGMAWDMKDQSSQADQTLAALRSFGLVVYNGNGPLREVSLSDEGRNYLRAQQESVKEGILKVCALRPKIMRQFWAVWGGDRPIDPVALDTLILQNGFSDTGARAFLRVYDATVTFAKLSTGDKTSATDEEGGEADPLAGTNTPPPVIRAGQTPPPKPSTAGKVNIMDGERVAFTEEGQPGQYLKLIASGDVDDTMLEALEDFVKRQRKRMKLAAILYPQGGADAVPHGLFAPGDTAPFDGAYKKHHFGHMPTAEENQTRAVMGQPFQSCEKCTGGQVRYEFIG